VHRSISVCASQGRRSAYANTKLTASFRLGDSKETVVATLGRPASLGDAIGLYRGWRHFTYDDSSQLRLTFYFIDTGDSYGPVDAIAALPAYRGKTKEGIGIGSLLRQVREAYGAPDTALSWPDQHVVADLYCMNQRRFEIHYKDSVVYGFSMGYFIPMPEDPVDPCK
jgi:hypothetical protein